jgi:hypothetical protein
MGSWVNYDPSVPWHGKYNATRYAEQNEQIKVVNWARSMQDSLPGCWPLIHVPNEKGGRGTVENKILKAMGVQAGTLDLLLPTPVFLRPFFWPGLWIEMKVVKCRMNKGKMQVQATEASTEQVAFAELMIERGYAVTIAWWETAAQDAIRRYLTREWQQPTIEELLEGYKR